MKLPNLFKAVKGQMALNQMVPIIITFVVVAITAVVGLQLLADEQADLTTGTAEYNATSDAITGVSKFPDKLPLIASVFVLVIIIGVLYTIYRAR